MTFEDLPSSAISEPLLTN